MKDSKKNIIIKTTEKDNVGIVANPEGVKKGDILSNDIYVSQNVPMGHKVALETIDKGDEIIRYGHAIGLANKMIQKGEWLETSKISLPKTPELNEVPLPTNSNPKQEKLEGYTFMGYKNPDGSVGTKNILGITTSVQCVSGFAEFVVKKIKQDILPKYPNVDDVVALNHTYGCGVAINVPEAVIPIRTIQNISTNPNFGGEVLVIGLGCEKLKPESLLLKHGKQIKQDLNLNSSNIFTMQDESFHGFKAMFDYALELAEDKLEKINNRKREICPASDLVVGMQCGGSDAFSGITSNPVAGFAADLIVRAGGSVLFSEVTEVRDAVHLLVPRCASVEVGQALIKEMNWYDNYLKQGKANTSANPAPGNKAGGLSNIVEKAMGSIAKSGTSTITDVLGPGEKIRRKGLTFAATPASDFICGTLQLAAGMNIHVFMTGRGTPYGLAMVPVIKVGSNSKLSNRWFDLIDLDAGRIATGEKTIEEMGWELFHLILDVASGNKKVACEKLGLHNDLVLFDPGPVT